MNKKLPIGGFYKQSLIDYPGNISAMVFTCGCNFRCGYCHNYELIDIRFKPKNKELDEDFILDWISKNNVMLDAVVITGGEPTLHSNLPLFIRKIKNFGLKVKLDTNGTNPKMLESLINENLINYVAMDIKAPLSLKKHQDIVGGAFNISMLEKIMQSIKILNQKRIDSEFRTTADETLSVDDFVKMAENLSGNYYLQMIRDQTTNSDSTKKFNDFKSFKEKTPVGLNLLLRE